MDSRYESLTLLEFSKDTSCLAHALILKGDNIFHQDKNPTVQSRNSDILPVIMQRAVRGNGGISK